MHNDKRNVKLLCWSYVEILINSFGSVFQCLTDLGIELNHTSYCRGKKAIKTV